MEDDLLDNLGFVELVQKEKLIAVIREKTYDEAKKNIKVALAAGIKLIEVTITTPKPFELIKEFSSSHKKIYFGTGSLISKNDAMNSIKSGAKFLVSPHFSKEVSLASIAYQVPYIPGIMTATEAMNAFECHHIVKLFPADVVKPKFISDIKKPLPFLNIIPSGNVSLKNIANWLKKGAIAVSVGSALFDGNNQAAKIKNAKKYINACQA